MTRDERKYEEKYLDMLRAIVVKEAADKPCKVFLFGSRATGRMKRFSDYDIGIAGLRDEDFRRLKQRIIDEVEESLIPHEVDIVNFDTVSESFRKIALTDAMVWKNG